MKYFVFSVIIGLITFWGDVILSSYIRIGDLKINYVLILLIVLMLKWPASFLFFYGMFLGFMCDALSHGMIGIYGISFFLTLILAKWIGESFYEDNISSTMLFVLLLTAVEGGISVTLFKILIPGISWNSLFLENVVPLAVIHGIISPIIFGIISYFGHLLKLELEMNNAL